MVGKWHLCPTDEMNLASHTAQLADRPRLRALVRVPRRGDEPVVSRPRLRQPPGRPAAARPRRATTSPTTSPTRRSSSSRTRRRSRPTSRSSSTTRPARATRRTTPRRSGSTSSRASFDMGYEAMREQTLARQKELGHRPRRHRAAADQPDRDARDARRARRQAVPGARHHPPVGLAERRREAAVRADGRGLRRLPRARRPPHRAAARLPRGDRAARQHDHRRRLRQRRERRGRPERLGQRDEVRQRRPGRPRREPREASTTSAARRPTTTTRTAGRWRSTRRSRCGSATSSTAARATRASSRGPQGSKARGEIRDQYHHAIDIVPTILDMLGVEPPETIKGHIQTPFDGVSMRASFDDAGRVETGKTQFYAMLGSRAIWHEGWKAVTTHPTHRRLGPLQRRRVGALPHRRRPLRAPQPGRRAARTRCGSWSTSGSSEAGANGALPARRPLGRRDPRRRRGPSSPRPATGTSTTRTRRRGPEWQAVNIRNRSFAIGALVDIPAPGAEGVLFALGSRFGGHALYVKDDRLHYVNSFVGAREQKIVGVRGHPDRRRT